MNFESTKRFTQFSNVTPGYPFCLNKSLKNSIFLVNEYQLQQMLYVLYNIHLCYIGPICGIALLIRKLQSFKDKKVRSTNFTENMFKRGLKLTIALENLAHFSVSEVILKQHSNQNKGKR